MHPAVPQRKNILSWIKPDLCQASGPHYTEALEAYQMGMWGMSKVPTQLTPAKPAPGFASGPQAACMHWNCSDSMVTFQRNSLSQCCRPGTQPPGEQLDRESSAVSLPDHYKTPNSISRNKLRLPGQKGGKNIQLSKLLIFHSVLWDFSSEWRLSVSIIKTPIWWDTSSV